MFQKFYTQSVTSRELAICIDSLLGSVSLGSTPSVAFSKDEFPQLSMRPSPGRPAELGGNQAEDMGFPYMTMHGGTPKWFIRDNPIKIKMDDLGVPLF